MIGERIKEAREKNGLTQAALAKKLGISRSAVNAWEMGISVPSARYLIELSRLLKVSADHLLGLDARELLDVSFLNEEEKRLIYALLDYFQKYGRTLRGLVRHAAQDAERVKRASEEAASKHVRAILEEVLLIEEEP